MAKIAKNPAVDPTLPKIPLVLDGETYHLCFTFGALALAEAKLRAVGVQANLLKALDLSSLDASHFVPLLYAAMITERPDIKFDKVASLVTFSNLGDIFTAITLAYGESLAEPKKDDMPKGKDEPELN